MKNNLKILSISIVFTTSLFIFLSLMYHTAYASPGINNLSWTLSESEITTATKIYRTNTDFLENPDSQFLIATVSAPTNTYDDTGVSANATYYYSLFQVDDAQVSFDPAYFLLVANSYNPPTSGGGGGGGGGGGPRNTTNTFAGCNGRTTGFSSTTGKSCVGNTNTTTTVAGCNGTNLFSSINGQRCPSTTKKIYNFGPVTLENGSRGEGVKELQRFLNANLNLGLVIDGKLGPKTIAVIKTWQRNHGLVPDGRVGRMTKAMMNSGL